jgi:hypothetical protein
MDHPDPDPLVVPLLNPAIEAVIGETGQVPTHRSENGTFQLYMKLATRAQAQISVSSEKE